LAIMKQKIEAPTAAASIRITPAMKAEDAKLKALRATKSAKEMTLMSATARVSAKVDREMKSVDVAFVMDCTGSMSGLMKAAQDKIFAVVAEVKSVSKGVQMRLAFVGYRNIHDAANGMRWAVQDFTDDPAIFSAFVGKQPADGGGDGLADVIGAYDKAEQLNWASRTRVMIHIGDTPGHGYRMHQNSMSFKDDYPNGDPDGREPESILPRLKAKKVQLIFARINNTTDIMMQLYKKIYDGIQSKAAYHLKFVELDSSATTFIPVVTSSITNALGAGAAAPPVAGFMIA